jgi:hypothetical protein
MTLAITEGNIQEAHRLYARRRDTLMDRLETA